MQGYALQVTGPGTGTNVILTTKTVHNIPVGAFITVRGCVRDDWAGHTSNTICNESYGQHTVTAVTANTITFDSNEFFPGRGPIASGDLICTNSGGVSYPSYSLMKRKHLPVSPIDETKLWSIIDLSNPCADAFGINGGTNLRSTIANGIMAVPAGSNLTLPGNPVIPHLSVVLSVHSFNNVSGVQPYIGIRNFANQAMFAAYNLNTSTISVFDGTNIVTETLALTTPFELGFQLTHNSVSAWVRPNGGVWTSYARSQVNDSFNIRRPAVLAGYNPFFYCPGGSDGDVKISGVRAGYLGSTGFANQSMLTYEDGTPMIKDGCFYFCANTCGVPGNADPSNFAAGLSATTFSIWKCDMTTWEPECVSLLNFVEDPGTSGNVELYGQNSGCVIYDRTTSQWILLVPNWCMPSYHGVAGGGTGGNPNNTTILTYTTTEDITHGVHVLGPGFPLILPVLPNFGGYDPCLVKIGTYWYLAYSRQATPPNSYPTIARAVNLTDTWTKLGDDQTTIGYNEGGKIVTIAGTHWAMWSGGDGVNGGMMMYNLDNIINNYQGIPLDLSQTTYYYGRVWGYVGYTNSNNHVGILPVTSNGNTTYYWYGWDDQAYQDAAGNAFALTWGNWIVQKLLIPVTGRQHPLIEFPYH